jgi:hypothetical protein
VRGRFRSLSSRTGAARLSGEQRRPAIDTRTTTSRVFVGVTTLCALGCALLAGEPGPPVTLAGTALLFAGTVVLARPQLAAAPEGLTACLPLTLAAALLLPPGSAVLAVVPGALLVPTAGRLRQAWNAGQLGLAAGVASAVFGALGGPRSLRELRFPALLVDAPAAALAFCTAGALLLGAVRALAERTAWLAGTARLLLGTLPMALPQGLAALLVALLWAGELGPWPVLLVALVLLAAVLSDSHARRGRAAHQAAVRALVQAVEIKDTYTRGHSERVSRAAVLIARELRMAEERVASLRVAGILHDVGKLGVPTRVLRKSGPLSDAEFAAVERHPGYGHEMVRGIDALGEARAGILHHHERMDGRGYPMGLAGEQIPEFARVIAVADAFDSMTSTRSYRRGRPVPEAVAELERCAGSQFDPRMVDALVRALAVEPWQPAPAAPGDADAPDLPLGLPAARSAPVRERR